MVPNPDAAAPGPSGWETFYRDFRKPDYIPGYEIQTQLGSGAFGLVYKAKKASINKAYAIKFLKVDDAEVRQAVLRELDSVRHFAQVDHPNLVSIEDQGSVDGIPYIVMAFGGTDTLRHRIDSGELDRDKALHLFGQVCRGVQALHEHSLVHFDIKPANVYLNGDVARVGDYGLSKLVTDSRNSLSMGRGTPYYMAPEIMRRKGDGRSDIYALGVMLYEMLCGEPPFRGDSEWEVLRKHEEATPEFPASIGEPERGVIARALAKNPEDRFESVGEMLATLQGASIEAGVAIGAAAPREPERFTGPVAAPAAAKDPFDGAKIGYPRPKAKPYSIGVGATFLGCGGFFFLFVAFFLFSANDATPSAPTPQRSMRPNLPPHASIREALGQATGDARARFESILSQIPPEMKQRREFTKVFVRLVGDELDEFLEVLDGIKTRSATGWAQSLRLGAGRSVDLGGATLHPPPPNTTVIRDYGNGR